MTRVVNLRTTNVFDVYIGRKPGQPHHYGNPFVVGDDGDRDEVTDMFEAWLIGGYPDVEPERRSWVLNNMHRLKDKILGCYCKPAKCHGDVYVKYLDSATPQGLI